MRLLKVRSVQVLVTGAAGFIGSAVTAALMAAGHGVRALDLRSPHASPDTSLALPADGVEPVTGDVRDAALLDRALDGVDAVSHHAAKVGLETGPEDLPDYVAANDLGTAVLLAAMARRGVRRLVLASSMVVYGEGRYSCPAHGDVVPPPRRAEDLAAGRFEPRCPGCGAALEPGLVGEDGRLDPRSGYAVTKLAQEQLAAVWARASGGRVAALRYHNVYGPNMPRDTPYAGVASFFRSALERGEAPRVFEDGRQRRDFVHVGDVARANLLALQAGYDGALNVCSGRPVTVGGMAEAIAAAYGGPAPVVTGEYRLGDVRHVVADPARAAQELGFVAEIAPGEGLREFARAPLRPASSPAATTRAAHP